MTNPFSNGARIAGTGSIDRKAFFGALIAVTATPLFLLPFYKVEIAGRANNLLTFAWLLAGYSHVMSTVWFGIDRDYRPVIATNKARMLGSLAILPFAMGGIAVASLGAASWMYAAYILWLAHHYNRQNYGMVAFAAANDGAGPLPREVGWMFHLTTVSGAICMVAMPTIYPGRISPFADPAYGHYGRMAAALFLLAAGVLLLRLLLARPELRRSPMVPTFLVLGWGFYAPALLGGANVNAFWPYAIAHGLQYLVMMAVVSRGSRMGLGGLVIAMGLAIPLGIVAISMSTAPLAQAYVGIVMWHFLADARLWRLRDPLVRGIVRQRFSFLFERGVPRVGPASASSTPSPVLRQAVVQH